MGGAADERARPWVKFVKCLQSRTPRSDDEEIMTGQLQCFSKSQAVTEPIWAIRCRRSFLLDVIVAMRGLLSSSWYSNARACQSVKRAATAQAASVR
jgi:hypothetical protein